MEKIRKSKQCGFNHIFLITRFLLQYLIQSNRVCYEKNLLLPVHHCLKKQHQINKNSYR